MDADVSSASPPSSPLSLDQKEEESQERFQEITQDLFQEETMKTSSSPIHPKKLAPNGSAPPPNTNSPQISIPTSSNEPGKEYGGIPCSWCESHVEVKPPNFKNIQR